MFRHAGFKAKSSSGIPGARDHNPCKVGGKFFGYKSSIPQKHLAANNTLREISSHLSISFPGNISKLNTKPCSADVTDLETSSSVSTANDVR